MVNGFKKTEAGIIPKDWEVTAIGEVSSPKARIGWQNMRKSEFLDSGSFMLITGTDFDGGRINYATCKYVSEERYNQDPNIQVGNGDILITKDGTLGKVALIRELSMKATLNAGVFVLRNLSPTVNNEFLYQYLSTNKLMDYARRTSTGGTIQHLNQKVLVNFPIPVPPLSEQRRIAKALGNMDELIAQSELEVHKWQAAKQGCLQRMFPQGDQSEPEMRFPDFTGAWVKRQLGEESIEILAGGDVDNSKLVSTGKYPVVANSLTNDGIVGYYEDEYRVQAPAVTVTGRGDIGHAQVRTTSFTPVVRLLSIVSRHNADFLSETINSKDIVVESTGVPQLTVPLLSRYRIAFPPTLDEECVVGEFFANLDRLIATRQRQVKKYRMIKQGMMKELLSGHTRLTEGDDAQ